MAPRREFQTAGRSDRDKKGLSALIKAVGGLKKFKDLLDAMS
jgi:hypothetical protein